MKAALIGFGYWGPNIAKNLNISSDFKLCAICDIDEDRLKKAKLLYGNAVDYYTDYNKMISELKLDMCAVALRNEAAQQAAQAVLKNGTHLFMEKPFAIKMEKANILKSLSEECNVLIHVNHVLVYNPVVRYIKNMIDNGEMGDLIYFESNRSNLGPHIKNDMNAMWDLAVHDLAILDYFFDGKQFTRVHCTGERRFSDKEILTYLSIKYADSTAMIKSSWFSPKKDRLITLCGEKKMVVFDDVKESEKLMIYDKGVELDRTLFREYGKYEAKIRTGDLYVPNIEYEDALQNGLIHFAKCIRMGQQSLTGPEQAMRVLSILEKAEEVLG